VSTVAPPDATSDADPDVARTPRHTARWIAGGLLAALVAVSIFLATRPSYQATEVASPLLGHPAPAFSQATLQGPTLSLAELRGHYVYVNFFASWCTPCQKEEPNLKAFYDEQLQHPGGAALLSVVYDDPDAAAAQFVASENARWPAIEDPGGAIALRYGVSSPPTTFLLDPEGRVVAEFVGPVTKSQLDGALALARSHGG
jgi:cytochrome c biogenesis protein CcmG/thiol:disulfide interchange protein DsbE